MGQNAPQQRNKANTTKTISIFTTLLLCIRCCWIVTRFPLHKFLMKICNKGKTTFKRIRSCTCSLPILSLTPSLNAQRKHTHTKTRKTPNLKHMEHAVKQTIRIFLRRTFCTESCSEENGFAIRPR